MKKFFGFLIILILGGFFLWQGIYLPKNASLGKEVIFNIEKGESSRDIALNLEKEGLIRWGPVLRVYVLIKLVSGKLQAGSYVLSSSMNIPEIVEKFVKGEAIKEKIIIIEGWNLRDIGFYLENKGMFQAEELWEIAGFPAIDYSKAKDLPTPKDFSSEYDFLEEKPKNIGLEGYLFPDTYEINKEINIEEIVRKTLNNFDKKLNPELKKEINKQGKTIFEIITIASLIEKEVKTKEDKELVSGILWKRLKNGVPLQIDSTIGYITGKQTTKISKEETKIDSPYNTYKYRGLPLGPISNPGLESILTAIYPESSNYWYYLSTPEGETIFSKTLEEHNIAKNTYLK